MASSAKKSKKNPVAAEEAAISVDGALNNDAPADAESVSVQEQVAEQSGNAAENAPAESEAPARARVVRRRRKSADESSEPVTVRRVRKTDAGEVAGAAVPGRVRRSRTAEARPQTKQEKDNARRTALESRISGVSKNDTMKVYMGEIGQISLISKTEEAELAAAILRTTKRVPR